MEEGDRRAWKEGCEGGGGRGASKGESGGAESFVILIYMLMQVTAQHLPGGGSLQSKEKQKHSSAPLPLPSPLTSSPSLPSYRFSKTRGRGPSHNS